MFCSETKARWLQGPGPTCTGTTCTVRWLWLWRSVRTTASLSPTVSPSSRGHQRTSAGREWNWIWSKHHITSWSFPQEVPGDPEQSGARLLTRYLHHQRPGLHRWIIYSVSWGETNMWRQLGPQWRPRYLPDDGLQWSWECQLTVNCPGWLHNGQRGLWWIWGGYQWLLSSWCW